MAPLPEPDAPLSIPLVVPILLWPCLGVWVVFLIGRRRRGAWPCSPGFGFLLIPACVLFDAATLIAAGRWTTPDSEGFVFTLLWGAAALSLTTFFALRAPDEPGEDEEHGGGSGPEPPWWPEFERDLRDYMRRRPRTPAGVR